MNCKNCGYELEPEMVHFCPKCGAHVEGYGTIPEPKPKTTVTVWFQNKDAWQIEPMCGFDNVYPWKLYDKGQYSFSGAPDVDRVIRDTLDKGALAIKIECTEWFNFMKYAHKSLLFWDKRLTTIHGHRDFSPQYEYWHTTYETHQLTWNNINIEQAITKYLAKNEPAHYAGEPFDEKWEYTGEYRLPKKGEAYTYFTRKIEIANMDYDHDVLWIIQPRGIHAKQQEQQIKVGDIVWYDGSLIANSYYKDFRKATPDEVYEWFTREVDGNKYIAYEDAMQQTVLFYDSTIKIVDDIFSQDFIKHHNIPVMPCEWLQAIGGEMRHPE